MTTPNDQVLQNNEQWWSFLSEQVKAAKGTGASPESIVDAATNIGSYLSSKVDPKSTEQRVLKDLWDKGDQQERHAMASMLYKMVSDGQIQ
jgi:hypothetical protein